jgi:hypothetical protein
MRARDVEKGIPSSLNSLAKGCCAFAPGEVLVPCGGILAPDHDGFFPDFAADVRASFDEADPMVDGSCEGDDLLASGAGPRTGGDSSHV